MTTPAERAQWTSDGGRRPDGTTGVDPLQGLAGSGTRVAALDAAGIPYSSTKPDGYYEQYTVDGVPVYVTTTSVNGRNDNGLTAAQNDYLHAVSNPYLAQQYKDSYLAGQSGAASGDGGFTGPGGPSTSPAISDADRARQGDARARITSVLAEYGLESLADFVWQQILGGKSDAEVLQDIRNTPQFKDRFPAIAERTAKGLAPISPGEYVAYERQARQIMRAAGLPENFYDTREDFTRFLNGDVSIAELNDRIQLGRQAAFEAPQDVRDALVRDYGMTEGDLTAFFLDEKAALPVLERKVRAAQIGGASTRTGFGATDRATNERLADLGVSGEQAQDGFGQLVQSRELFQSLDRSEDVIGQDEQLGAVFAGNANAQRRIEQRRRKRSAQFEGGGSFASSQQGVSGLGSMS